MGNNDYDNAIIEEKIIIGNPTVSHLAEYMVMNDFIDGNTIWNAGEITISNGEIDEFFREGHKLFLNIPENAGFIWYNPEEIAINTLDIDLFSFDSVTLVFEIDDVFYSTDEIILQNVKFEIISSSTR